MADREAQEIVHQVVVLTKAYAHIAPLEILDLAMENHLGSEPNFEVCGQPWSDWTDEASPLGALMRRALGADGCSHALLLARYAERYALWHR